MKELSNRFRVIENPRTFRVQFSHRDQKPGETVEEYAAELKRLYDKAHPDREHGVRREDLLRRFLDGLCNESARFQVEYFKEPANIDEAAFEVVNYLETKTSQSNDKRNRQPTRLVQPADESGDEGDTESDDQEDRTPKQKYENPVKNSQPSAPGSGTKRHQPGKVTTRSTREKHSGNIFKNETGHQQSQIESRVCYNCNVRGHLSRDCRQPRANTRPGWSTRVYGQPADTHPGNQGSSTSTWSPQQPRHWSPQQPNISPQSGQFTRTPISAGQTAATAAAYNSTNTFANTSSFQPPTAIHSSQMMQPQSSADIQSQRTLPLN